MQAHHSDSADDCQSGFYRPKKRLEYTKRKVLSNSAHQLLV